MILDFNFSVFDTEITINPLDIIALIIIAWVSFMLALLTVNKLFPRSATDVILDENGKLKPKPKSKLALPLTIFLGCVYALAAGIAKYYILR